MATSNAVSPLSVKANIAVTQIYLSGVNKTLSIVMPLFNVNGVLNWHLSSAISTPRLFIGGALAKFPKEMLAYCSVINRIQMLVDNGLQHVKYKSTATNYPVYGTDGKAKFKLELALAPIINKVELESYWQTRKLTDYQRAILTNKLDFFDQRHYDKTVNDFFIKQGNNRKLDTNRSSVLNGFGINRFKTKMFVDSVATLDSYAKNPTHILDVDECRNKLITRLSSLHIERLLKHGLNNVLGGEVNPELHYFPLFHNKRHSQKTLSSVTVELFSLVADVHSGTSTQHVRTTLLTVDPRIYLNTVFDWLTYLPLPQSDFITPEQYLSFSSFDKCVHDLGGEVGFKF